MLDESEGHVNPSREEGSTSDMIGTSSQPGLAKQESKQVYRFRILMLMVLTVFAFVISGLVYFYARKAENDEFKKEFRSQGSKVITAFSDDSYRKMQALFSLSSSLTARALSSNSTWPFVTIPNSAQEFGPYLSLAEVAALAVFPIVPKHLRAEWEAYSVQEQGWIDEDLKATGQDEIAALSTEILEVMDNEDTATHSTISPFIKNYVGVDTSPGVWTPWCIIP